MFDQQSGVLPDTGEPVLSRYAESTQDDLVRHLLDRISTQEVEIVSLRQLEETIRRNTYLFEILLKKSQEGILLLTPEMMFLRLVHPLFGRADKEVVGQHMLAYIHPDDHEQLREMFTGLTTGRITSGTCRSRILNSDSSWVWTEIEMTDLLDDQQVQAIVFNYRIIPGAQLGLEPRTT